MATITKTFEVYAFDGKNVCDLDHAGKVVPGKRPDWLPEDHAEDGTQSMDPGSVAHCGDKLLIGTDEMCGPLNVTLKASAGDMIVRDEKGRISLCSAEAFAEEFSKGPAK